ncbi:hypothetical protein BDF22DRAFT_670024 [Syncephalis plumigaleata]|nr:hypothetical protein BDF22DRAFT_670024 [Syncephalis plumigaleata]
MMDPGNPILPAEMDPLFDRPLVDMQPSVPFTTLTHGNPAKHHDIVVPDPSSNPLPHAPMKSTGPHRPNAGPTPVNLRPHAPPPSDFPQTVFPAHPPPSGSRPKHHGGRHHSGRTPPHAAHTISRGSSNHHKHHHTSPAGKATPTKAAPLPNSAHEKAPTGIVAVNEILTRPTSAVSEAPNGRQIPELTPVFKHSEEKDRPLTEHMPSFHTATPLSPERITAPVRPSMPDLMPTMDHEFIPLNATPAPTVQSVHSPAASSSPMIQSNSHPAPQETPIEHTIATATPIPAKATPLHRPDTTTITSQEPAANTHGNPQNSPAATVMDPPKVPEPATAAIHPGLPPARVPPSDPTNSVTATAPAPAPAPPNTPVTFPLLINPNIQFPNFMPMMPANQADMPIMPANRPNMPMMPPRRPNMPMMPPHRPNMPMMPPRRPNMPMMPPHRPSMPMMPPHQPSFMEHSPSPFDEMDLMPSHPRSNDWSNALMDDNSSDFSMNDDDDLEDDPDSDAWDDDLDDE